MSSAAVSHIRRSVEAPHWQAICATLAAGVSVGACGVTQPPSRGLGPAALRAAFAGSPPVLAQLHERGNQLPGGGISAFQRQLRALRGLPVVVNVWASWSVPVELSFRSSSLPPPDPGGASRSWASTRWTAPARPAASCPGFRCPTRATRTRPAMSRARWSPPRACRSPSTSTAPDTPPTFTNGPTQRTRSDRRHPPIRRAEP